MKTREEQIEEMAKAIYATGVALDGTDYAFGVYADDDHFHKMANALCAAGYRKQSDTVREILKRITNYSLDFNYDLKLEVQKIAEEYGAEVEE